MSNDWLLFAFDPQVSGRKVISIYPEPVIYQNHEKEIGNVGVVLTTPPSNIKGYRIKLSPNNGLRVPGLFSFIYCRMICLIENAYIIYTRFFFWHILSNELPNWKRIYMIFLLTYILLNDLPNWKRIDKLGDYFQPYICIYLLQLVITR